MTSTSLCPPLLSFMALDFSNKPKAPLYGGGTRANQPIATLVAITCLSLANEQPQIYQFAAPKWDDGGWAERARRAEQRREINPL